MKAQDARKHALEAALDAVERIERLNDDRAAAAKLPLEFGLALRSGEVTYGNIGTKNRLELTVIGDAANRAARGARPWTTWTSSETRHRVVHFCAATLVDFYAAVDTRLSARASREPERASATHP